MTCCDFYFTITDFRDRIHSQNNDAFMEKQLFGGPMYLSALNPFLRFAAEVCPSGSAWMVKVTDCRIFYVEEGAAQIHIDGAVLSLQRDSLFYCPGGSIYTVVAQPGLRLICLNFDLTREHEQELQSIPVCAHQQQWAQLPVYFSPIEDSSFLNRHLLITDGFRMRNAILELQQEHKKAHPIRVCLQEAC